MKLDLKIMNTVLYDLKLSSFLKMKHRICKEFVNFYKFLFIQQKLRKKSDLLGKILTIFITSCNKFHSKNHLYEEKKIGEKRHTF
jgi:hypothetical protein